MAAILIEQRSNNEIDAADGNLREAFMRHLQLKQEVVNAVKVVKEIAGVIQEQEHIRRVGGIVYSITGFASGSLCLAGLTLAPVTLGVSLAVTAVGTAVGAGNAVARVTHDIVKESIINEKLADAKAILKAISQKWEELHILLETVLQRLGNLNPSIRRFISDPKNLMDVAKAGKELRSFYNASKALNLFRKGKIEVLQKFLCIGTPSYEDLTKVGSKLGVRLVKTSRGITQVTNNVMVPMPIVSLVMGVKDIYDRSIELSNGELNEIAKALIESADQMLDKMESLSEIFED